MEFIRITTENVDMHLDELQRLNTAFAAIIGGTGPTQLFPEWEDEDRDVYVSKDGTATFTLLRRKGEVRISRIYAPGVGQEVLAKISELYPGIKLTTNPANKRAERFFQAQGFIPNDFSGLWER
jgi:hypothetical protein